MKLKAVVLAAVCWLVANVAVGQCQFDNFGTIANPDDPTCRDARFEFTESPGGGTDIPLGYPVPVPVDSLTGVAGFRTYSSLHARHQDLALTNTNIAAYRVGQTLAGRDIWAYRIGDPDELTQDGLREPAMLTNGTIHAREWQSPEAVTEVLEQLLEIADDGGFGSFLMDNVNVVILPVLNVDGFIQTQRFPASVAATRLQPRDGRMRRKNLRKPGGGALVDDDLDSAADQFLGVDLNRNTVHGYGLNNGSSTDPVSLVYRGANPASEPETLALLASAALAPADRLRFYADVHSYSRVLLMLRTANTRLNAITSRLATRVRAVTDNRYLASLDPPGAEVGVTADFFSIEYQVPSWTLEIEPRNGGQDYGGTGVSHSGFVLPDTEVPRMRDEIAAMLMLAYFRMAGPPSVTAAQITRRSDDAVVFRADWTTEAANGTRRLDVSTNDGLIERQGYRLWLAFDKPMRFSSDGQTVSNYAGQPAADFATLSLDSGPADADLSIGIAGGAGNWLAQPGGAPDGYHRYRFDALSADFEVPGLGADAALSLSVDAADLSLQRLDADPSTVADFVNGAWVGYEDELGDALDVGGVDCKLGLAARTSGSTAPALQPVACKAAAVAAPPPPPLPPPAPAPPPASSGGGGGALWPLWLLLMPGRRRRG